MKNENEFSKIKMALDGESPSAMDIHRWKVALRQKQNNQTKSKFPAWMQWAVAATVGFIVGATSFQKSNPENQENFMASDATIERVYTKL